MRLRGLTGARDEFHLADIAQNLKTLANHHWRRPSSKPARVDDQRSTWIAVYGKSRTAGAD
jgi:hypothetical protein